MCKMYPYIHRKRKSLEPATVPAVPPVVSVCPHCGRSSDEPVLKDVQKPSPEPAQPAAANNIPEDESD